MRQQYLFLPAACSAISFLLNGNELSGPFNLVAPQPVSNTTFTPVNPLVPGTKYYWQVNARYILEGGPWSAANFTTATAPAAAPAA